MISKEVLEQVLREEYARLRVEEGKKREELEREAGLIQSGLSYSAPTPYSPTHDLFHYERGYRELRAEKTMVGIIAAQLEERTGLKLNIGRSGETKPRSKSPKPPETTRREP